MFAGDLERALAVLLGKENQLLLGAADEPIDTDAPLPAEVTAALARVR